MDSSTNQSTENQDITQAKNWTQNLPEGWLEWGRKFFEWRSLTPIPLVLLLLYFAQPSAISATFGLLFVVVGELIRIYSVAFIGGVSRTRSLDTTGGQVVTEGAYGLVRNPLYVGNFFLAFGFAVYGGRGFLVILTAVLFAVQYYAIVLFEEKLLEEKFGESYRNYKDDVPAWFPRKRIKLSDIPFPPDLGAALKSEKRTMLAILGMLLALMLRSNLG